MPNRNTNAFMRKSCNCMILKLQKHVPSLFSGIDCRASLSAFLQNALIFLGGALAIPSEYHWISKWEVCYFKIVFYKKEITPVTRGKEGGGPGGKNETAAVFFC